MILTSFLISFTFIKITVRLNFKHIWLISFCYLFNVYGLKLNTLVLLQNYVLRLIFLIGALVHNQSCIYVQRFTPIIHVSEGEFQYSNVYPWWNGFIKSETLWKRNKVVTLKLKYMILIILHLIGTWDNIAAI